MIYEDKTEKSISKVNLAKGFSFTYFNNDEKGSENITGLLFRTCEKKKKNLDCIDVYLVCLMVDVFRGQSTTSIKNLQTFNYVWAALRALVPFVQFKKCEKHPWRVILLVKLEPSACNFTTSITPPRVIFTFFKLCKWY